MLKFVIFACCTGLAVGVACSGVRQPVVHSSAMLAVVEDGNQVIEEGQRTGRYTFPAGYFQISEQIDLGTKAFGIVVEGAGCAYQKIPTILDRQVTRLEWVGEPGVPMFVGGIREAKFRDFTIINSSIHVDAVRDIGTGLCHFERIVFHGPLSGVLFGNETYNGNAADSVFRDCEWVRSREPVRLTTSQNVNYKIYSSMFYTCGCVCKVNGGGLVKVADCYLTDTPYVFMVEAGATETASGNGTFVVDCIFYDRGKSQVPPVLVKDITNVDAPKKAVRTLHRGVVHGPGGTNVVSVQTDKAPWTVDDGKEIVEVWPETTTN